MATPHTHSRHFFECNFFRTAPLKACDEASRPSVRWPVGGTEVVRPRRIGGRSTSSTPTASAPPAPFTWRARPPPQGKASVPRRGFHGLSVRQTDLADKLRRKMSLWGAFRPKKGEKNAALQAVSRAMQLGMRSISSTCSPVAEAAIRQVRDPTIPFAARSPLATDSQPFVHACAQAVPLSTGSRNPRADTRPAACARASHQSVDADALKWRRAPLAPRVQV